MCTIVVFPTGRRVALVRNLARLFASCQSMEAEERLAIHHFGQQRAAMARRGYPPHVVEAAARIAIRDQCRAPEAHALFG